MHQCLHMPLNGFSSVCGALKPRVFQYGNLGISYRYGKLADNISHISFIITIILCSLHLHTNIGKTSLVGPTLLKQSSALEFSKEVIISQVQFFSPREAGYVFTILPSP